jgi:hypothetical protein
MSRVLFLSTAAAFLGFSGGATIAQPSLVSPEVFNRFEYTAQFRVKEDGSVGLQLAPVSPSAVELDSRISESISTAVFETSTLLRQVGLTDGDPSELTRTSALLLNGAFGEALEDPTIQWSNSGLTVGYAPVGTSLALSTLSTADWSGGFAFVAPTDEVRRAPGVQGNLILAELPSGAAYGLDYARMKEIAKQAAEEMFSSAAESACDARIRPKEITPAVSVSFNLFAGAEFSISATYDVGDLCGVLDLD